MGYWPSYSSIVPQCRTVYLEWLAAGKNDPGAYIGYVFLYFYGLERRALADARSSPAARAEIPAIIRETERLLAIYSGDASFNFYASRFIDMARMSSSTDRLYKSLPVFGPPSYEFPPYLKIALGQLVVDGLPLPAGWALAWVEQDPLSRLRTPARQMPRRVQAALPYKVCREIRRRLPY